jgi:serine/threonine protein kinase
MGALFSCLCCAAAENQNDNEQALIDPVGKEGAEQAVIPEMQHSEVIASERRMNFPDGGSAFVQLVTVSYQGEDVTAVQKCIRYSVSARLLQIELNILATIQQDDGHDNIIRCFGYTIANSPMHYGSLILEYANRADLQAVFGNVSLHQALRSQMPNMCQQIAAGLDYIHSKGIIHRDLKMENILLHIQHGWQIKIADFGSAAIIPAGQSAVPVDIDLVTTPEYVAPEVFQRPYGTKVDMYAFAIVLWSMATMNKHDAYPGLNAIGVGKASNQAMGIFKRS